YLPAVEEPVAEVSAEPENLETFKGTETVLVVEDEDVVRAMATEVLRENGYHVLEAEHATEALTVSNEYDGEIHLMLTDVVMPLMSGRDLAKRLRPLRPDMKVLYMSGYTDDAIVHHGVLEKGMAFIGKPFSIDALSRKLREVLDNHVTV
ncbi:MAG TPA: response regulator, partial [Pyrinomonadaceae bacterium]